MSKSISRKDTINGLSIIFEHKKSQSKDWQIFNL